MPYYTLRVSMLLAALACCHSAQAQSVQLALGNRVSTYTTGTDGVVDLGPDWNSTGAGAGSTGNVAQYGSIVGSDGEGTLVGVSVQLGVDSGGSGNAAYSTTPQQSGSSPGGGVFNNGLWENWAFTNGNDNVYVRINGLAAGEYNVYALTREFSEPGRIYDAYAGVDTGGSDADDDIGDLTLLGFGTTADDDISLDRFEDYHTNDSLLAIDDGDSLVVAVDPVNAAFATLQGLQIEQVSADLTCDVDGTAPLDCDLDDFAIIRQNFFGTGLTESQGDLTGEGDVNYLDFKLWKEGFLAMGGSAAALQAFQNATSVPEPSSLALLLLCSMGGCVRISRLRIC